MSDHINKHQIQDIHLNTFKPTFLTGSEEFYLFAEYLDTFDIIMSIYQDSKEIHYIILSENVLFKPNTVIMNKAIDS